MQNFGRQVQGAEVALFYYAGHGVQVNGSNYLVPVSANPTREADVDFQMVDINLVLRQMQGSGTRLNMVILDACRNNPFGARGLRSSDGGLAQMRAPEGTLISYATQPGSVAQDGSDGHSIGNDEKSLSGSRQAPRSVEPERPARRSNPEAEEPRRSASRRSGGGGGGGSFDGAWVVVGVGATCSGGSTTAVVVSSGRIIGQGVSGQVSATGFASAVGNSNGITVISSGHLSGRSGSGTFRQSDGCAGRWTASKQ